MRRVADEVRLHHVFEHFTRPVALALAASWRSWLRPGGMLRIEVPDFERTVRSALRTFATTRRRHVGIRHLFGSHEAEWAVHREGWTEGSLREVYRLCGDDSATEMRLLEVWMEAYRTQVDRSWATRALPGPAAGPAPTGATRPP